MLVGAVGVGEGVRVRVGVAVDSGEVGVRVGVRVGVCVLVGVRVGVDVDEGVGVDVRVGVDVGSRMRVWTCFPHPAGHGDGSVRVGSADDPLPGGEGKEGICNHVFRLITKCMGSTRKDSVNTLSEFVRLNSLEVTIESIHGEENMAIMNIHHSETWDQDALHHDPPRILVADIDLIGLRTSSAILREAGYHVVTTPDSDRVLQITEKTKPNLILLSMELKGQDGIQTCRLLREKLGRTIPILFYSSDATETSIIQAFEAGANDYLPKPCPPGLLRAKVKVLLGKIRTIPLEPNSPSNIPSVETSIIPGYSILETLGTGSTGTVHRAIHNATGEIVAIKVLNPNAIVNSREIQRFFRGSMIGLELQHPNLVQILEVKRFKEGLYEIMEFVPGQTLHIFIKSGYRLKEHEAMIILEDIGKALDHLHKHDVLHRDVKPSNIFVMADWHSKLGDMGISKKLIDRSATTIGHVVGTPGYISPEQAMDIQPVDIRSDLYSLGLTLFHAVAGINPYERSTAYTTMLARVEDPEAELDPGSIPGLSSDFCAIINKLIRRRVLDRYDNPNALLTALHHYKESHR